MNQILVKGYGNEGVERIAKAICGDRVNSSLVAGGGVTITAQTGGLLKVKRQAVEAVNHLDSIMLSTRHSDIVVKSGELVAAMKMILQVMSDEAVLAVEKQLDIYWPVIEVKPFNNLKVGAVITGNDVYHGRIHDRFFPVIREKIKHYGGEMMGTTYRPDDPDLIRDAVLAYKHQGADVVIAAGGMSVEPDDVTPEGIRSTGAQVILYGVPVLPGAMFMLAYLDHTAIIGLPACSMYSKITVFDLIFPRILAGERLSKEDIISLGYGGLCMKCSSCSYPHCPFGR